MVFLFFFFRHLAKRSMLILLVESTRTWLMERRSQSRIWKLNLCPEAKIVPFGSVLYGCYLDLLLDILDARDILDVLLRCLCVDVIVNIWIFIYGCYVWMCKTCKCEKRAERAECCLFARNEYFTAFSHTHTHTHIYI